MSFDTELKKLETALAPLKGKRNLSPALRQRRKDLQRQIRNINRKLDKKVKKNTLQGW